MGSPGEKGGLNYAKDHFRLLRLRELFCLAQLLYFQGAMS